MTIRVLFESDYDAAPHSPSAPIKARLLVGKIKHCIDLDDSVCNGLSDVDSRAHKICFGNRVIFSALLQILQSYKILDKSVSVKRFHGLFTWKHALLLR